jgi:hypothetical protein
METFDFHEIGFQRSVATYSAKTTLFRGAFPRTATVDVRPSKTTG